MASGTSKIPYLGCKISLISNAGIRYEGILYTVDVKDSTLALAKVVSFGTEDRPTDKPVPVRSEVYDYIIFRATDIKDVRLCDSPKVRNPSIESDPAIVKHSEPASSSTSAFAFPPGNFRAPPAAAGPFGSIGTLPPGYPVSLFDVLSGSRHGSGNYQHGNQQRHQQDRRQRAQQQPRRRTTSLNSTGEPGRQGRSQQQGRNRQGRVSFSQQDYGQQHDNQQHRNNQGYRGGQRGRGGRGRGGRGRGRGRGGWNRGQSGSRNGRPRSLSRTGSSKPMEADFDFDAAEQEFQKLFSNMKLGKPEMFEEIEAPTPFVVDRNVSPKKSYDKSASFFDMSSPLPEEGPVERQDWRKERKMNAETFGQAEIRRAKFHNFRAHRGNYRSYRGAHSGVPPAPESSTSPAKSPTVIVSTSAGEPQPPSVPAPVAVV